MLKTSEMKENTMKIDLRKITLRFLFVALCLPLLSAAPQPLNNGPSTQEEVLLKQISKGFSTVSKKAIPAVVYIESQGATSKETTQNPRNHSKRRNDNPFEHFQDEFFNRFFGYPYYDERPKKKETVKGSGFIVSSDGYIMTNDHVVENATKVSVSLQNGRKLTATVIGTDSKTDLAIIKIDEKNLPFLQFGDSDKLEVGDWAIAIGNPFGLQASVTVGVVSAKGRNQLNITDFEDFIQTDAAINPGNSGGPLLDIEGKVIGINTAIVSGTGGYMGIGFAIPSNMATCIMDQLIKTGSVTRGFLGVTLQPIDSELATYYHLDNVQGALVTEVVENSPAQKAGLKQEDIILSYNNLPVENLSSFRNAISFMAPGTQVMLVVKRDGKEIKIPVIVSTAVNDVVVHTTTGTQKLGLKVENLTPEMSQKSGIDKGVVVTEVLAGTTAAELGIQPGSIILAVNRKKISNVDDFNAAVQEAIKEKRILLMLKQGEATRFVAIPLD